MFEEEEESVSARGWLMVNRTKIILIGFSLLVILIVVSALTISIVVLSDSNNNSQSDGRPNVIFMISDGFSPSSETFARVMSGRNLLELDSMHIGTVRTYSSMSWITDSAAGATAYACGVKTYNEAIAVDDDIKALGTAMEAAKKLGMTTAIVTTSRITHATPAAFSSHVSERNMEEEIAYQQANDQNVDLLFGGGQQMYLQRADGENLFDTMEERGYSTITTIAEFNQPQTMPLIGLFAEEHLDFEIDRIRQNPPTQPSLSEMVQKALTMLEDNGNPFFLLIEGARIDMSAHNHDAYTHYMEIMQYQDSVALVKAFVDEHPNTYVISVADHATGGISTGRFYTNGSYPDPYVWFPDKLRTQTASVEFMEAIIEEQGLDALNATVQEYCGITLTDEEFSFIMHQYDTNDNALRGLRNGIGTVMSGRAIVGWTTPGHTGVDVNLYSYGKRASGTGGVMQNVDVGNFLWEEIGLKDTMEEITSELSTMNIPVPKSKSKSDRYHGHD